MLVIRAYYPPAAILVQFPGVISPVLAAMEGVVEEARTRLEELATTSSDQQQRHIHTELQVNTTVPTVLNPHYFKFWAKTIDYSKAL